MLSEVQLDLLCKNAMHIEEDVETFNNFTTTRSALHEIMEYDSEDMQLQMFLN